MKVKIVFEFFCSKSFKKKIFRLFAKIPLRYSLEFATLQRSWDGSRLLAFFLHEKYI